MKKTIHILLTMIISIGVNHTQNIPGPVQKEAIGIRGASIYCGDGRIIQDGIIAFEKGKITYLGETSTAPINNQDKYQWIEAKGKRIYPGFIAMQSQLGLSEIEAVKATNDYNELGQFNPHIRSVIAYNTDSEVLPTVRNNGILLTQIAPEGGVISGQSSVMQLDAWNWEDAIVKNDEGIFMNWPSPPSPLRTDENAGKARDEYEMFFQKLSIFFDEAKAYSFNQAPIEKNLRFEAMRKVFDRKSQLYLRANSANDIQAGVVFLKKYGIQPILIGGNEAWRIINFIKENNITVVLTNVQSLPGHDDDNVAQPFMLPGILEKAGIRFAIAADGFWQQRNLPFQVGQAVPYGLSMTGALNAVTKVPAEIMGVSDRLGTLAVGKDATMFISTGDAFDMMGNNVERIFIQGRVVSTNDKQKALYNKYKSKYGL